MHIGIFAAWAVPQVHAELKHGKTILEHIVPEFAGIFPVEFGLGWQVEHNEYPHNTISVEAIRSHSEIPKRENSRKNPMVKFQIPKYSGDLSIALEFGIF